MIGPARWSEKYLRIPFKDPGFGMNGCHCWGLIWLVFQRELGITLDKYEAFTAAQLRQIAKVIDSKRFLEPWVPVIGNRKPFDVVVIACEVNEGTQEERRFKIHGHVGIASGQHHILHIEEGIQSQNMPDTHVRLANRIIGSYRHQDLVNR